MSYWRNDYRRVSPRASVYKSASPSFSHLGTKYNTTFLSLGTNIDFSYVRGSKLTSFPSLVFAIGEIRNPTKPGAGVWSCGPFVDIGAGELHWTSIAEAKVSPGCGGSSI